MSDVASDESRFWEIYAHKPGELWREPFSERALRMHSLVLLETQVNGGGLRQWYTNPSGTDGERTVDALEEIGASSLATGLRDALGELSDRFGERGAMGMNATLTDEQMKEARDICRKFDRMFEASLFDSDTNFYRLVVAWWERSPKAH